MEMVRTTQLFLDLKPKVVDADTLQLVFLAIELGQSL